jgi:dTDP-4-amino-4,6-dideoxygalactose transaminase
MFDKILKFEKELAEFTGAPYAIMTDCCTHAIELCLRYELQDRRYIDNVAFTAFTYLSVPMTFHKLGIKYTHVDYDWIGEYPLYGTRIWDSARKLQPNMYAPHSFQCLSFGQGKPLQIGRGGAILLDDKNAYTTLLAMRYDGRDLTISPWQDQKVFRVGYHYKPTIEEAEIGSAKLEDYIVAPQKPVHVNYPDLREIQILC